MTHTEPDQAAQHKAQDEIEALSEKLDGADLFTVLMVVSDAMDFELRFALECVRDDGHDAPGWRIVRDMLETTQSEMNVAIDVLIRMCELDELISNM